MSASPKKNTYIDRSTSSQFESTKNDLLDLLIPIKKDDNFNQPAPIVRQTSKSKEVRNIFDDDDKKKEVTVDNQTNMDIDIDLDQIHHFAFPSLSTLYCSFPIQKASKIIYEVIFIDFFFFVSLIYFFFFRILTY